jgi:hypothetical protein
MSNIAIASQIKYTTSGESGFWYDDQELQTALKSRGHRVEIIGWENAEVDLLLFDSIFVSSTWNACDDPSKFISWLNACERDNRRRLINDRDVIKSGFLKHRYWHLLEDYLRSNPEIWKLGQLTPSRFFIDGNCLEDSYLEPITTRTLADVLVELDRDPLWANSNIVLKPVVSADGIDTFVYNRFNHDIPIDAAKRAQFVINSPDEAEAVFRRLVGNTARYGTILQPYLAGVEVGELSLTVLGGTCTHAIRKPKLFKGDDSSRREAVPLNQLPASMQSFAEVLVKYLDSHFGEGKISRARVDLFEQGGKPVLCELECVEPNSNLKVWANYDKKSTEEIVQRYASIIESRTAVLNQLNEDATESGTSPD